MYVKLFILSLLLSFSTMTLAASGKFMLFLKGFKTEALSQPRDVYVYIPAEYAKNKNKNYPVLYMQDGQNLFDPQRAFMGQTWKAEASLNQLIGQKLMAPIIVVAIDNTALRTDEYTHDRDAEEELGGRADDYLKLILNNIKPIVDQNLRTKRDRKSTGILGSSLGGLVSLYAGVEFSSSFGLIGAMSPSVWWNQNSILNRVRTARELPLKVYLDSGDTDGEKPADVQLLSSIFKQRGFVNGKEIKTVIQAGASHSEKFWAQRFPVALQFLFPSEI